VLVGTVPEIKEDEFNTKLFIETSEGEL